MLKLGIVDLLISAMFDKPYFFRAFSSLREGTPDLVISVNCCDYIEKPEGVPLLNERIQWVRKTDGSGDISIYIRGVRSSILYMLEVNERWSNAKLSYLKDVCNEEYAVTGPLGEILFRNFILYHQGIVIHSSAIRWGNKGIIYSAPSGTGKSTQTNLWRKYMGAEILNDDRPAIRIVDGQPFIYGTPWSGSSCDFINGKAPLSAIILLEQAPYNEIQLLTIRETLLRLMPRCFLPYFDQNLIDMAVNILGKIVQKVPVYLLKCRPDREAVELVHQCVK